jgi:Protein of unknown function (DUF992)
MASKKVWRHRRAANLAAVAILAASLAGERGRCPGGHAARRQAQMRRRRRVELHHRIEPCARLRLYAGRLSARVLQGQHQQDRHRYRLPTIRRDCLGGVVAGLMRGPGALTGNYVGLSADVAAGLGAGANALIGGNKVVLQPLSVSGNIGINLAAGIGDITLTYVGGPAPVLREFVPFSPQ